ncbi:hypothetical protein CC86DRAFT_390650 [Ophiobolus disseminans]|uniref:HTH CENPB-type domain-containing protein n=1 Tax=Ophiobolus disseminans TaxID=1469910 RepID=A0A6A7AJ19_9PLEO|nr:hypothetical protein CC86DRAFT_390650 [Ophiobolus disseminans]
MALMDNAIATIKLLEPGKQFLYGKIAAKYGCSHSAFSKRHQGQVLHPQQEQALLRYIERLTRQGLSPTRPMIRNFGSQIAKKSLAYTGLIALSSATRLISSQSGQQISQYNVKPCHTYNMDEKGFVLGVVSRSKRVFSRRLYEEGKIKAYLQDGCHEWITLLACVCADGTALEPALIYQSASGSIQDSWLQAFDPDNHQVRFASSPSGWTNNNIGLTRLKQISAFLERCQGLTSMSKRDFYPMFMAAWEASFKETTILEAFEATGLSPFEPEEILKRLRRNRGKVLPLEAPEEYHGGAVFWSPRKVREARDRLQQQEAEEEQQRLQKVEAAKARKERKREARAEARILREKEEEEKTAEHTSRAAACSCKGSLQKKGWL